MELLAVNLYFLEKYEKKSHNEEILLQNVLADRAPDLFHLIG